MGGELPINPSGGVIACNPIGATGLIRCAEAALQVMGKAEARQVPDVNFALSTGFGGCMWSDVLLHGKKNPIYSKFVGVRRHYAGNRKSYHRIKRARTAL